MNDTLKQLQRDIHNLVYLTERSEDMNATERFTNATQVYNYSSNATENGTENEIKDITFYSYQTEQTIFLSIIFVAIVFGNLTVLISIFRSHSKRRSRMHFFIMHLAIADLSVGFVFVLTDLIWNITVVWYAGNIGCKLIKYLQTVVIYSSTYMLVAMSIDRLEVIARPMNFTGHGTRAKVMVCFVWTLSFLFSIPQLFTFRGSDIYGRFQCWMLLPEHWHWQLYITCLSALVLIIPALIITACYIGIVGILWSRTRHTKLGNRIPQQHVYRESLPYNGVQNGVSNVIARAKIKTVKMTLIIVLAFIVCWSPFFLYDLLDVYGHIEVSQSSIAWSTFIQSFAPLNSAANPIIYFLFNGKLLKKKSLKWSRLRRRISKRLSKRTTGSSTRLTEFKRVSKNEPASEPQSSSNGSKSPGSK